MVRIYADLHIHVGRTSRAAPVKTTASPRLNLESIVKTAEQKGLQLVGLVDAACSGVLQDLKELVENGTLQPLEAVSYTHLDVYKRQIHISDKEVKILFQPFL